MTAKEWTKIDNFTPKELTCKCGECAICNPSFSLLQKLDLARIIIKEPIIILSGCRCESYNNTVTVGGSPTSSHIASASKESTAVDIKVSNSSYRYKLIKTLLNVGFTRLGIYKNFIHVDCDLSKPKKVIWCK